MLMVRDCPADLDNEFGPQVNTCLRAFDFTLTFEESILTILPTGLFLVAAVPRLIFLLRRPRLTQRKGLRTTKLVCLSRTAPIIADQTFRLCPFCSLCCI